MKNKLPGVYILIILLTLVINGCGYGDSLEEQRRMWENNPEKPVTFAVAGRLPFLTDSTGFMNGALLALEEINQSGGVAGRLLQLETYDDEASAMEGTLIARDLIQKDYLSAVIGHTSTHVTLPVSTIYEEAGMLMISPIVSNSQLTQRGYRYIYQNIPGDDDIGREMAEYAWHHGIRRIVINYVDNEYGRGLANAFESAADELGLMVVDRTTHFPEETFFLRALKKWQAMDYEAVFIADSMRTGQEFLFLLKEAGETPVILGDAGMDSNFIESFGDFAEGAILASLANMETGGSRMDAFSEAYLNAFGDLPDEWAIQGYETIHLLAEAVERGLSPSPPDVAAALDTLEWEGITGIIQFDETGRVTGKPIHQKRVVDGRFIYEDRDLE